MEREDHTELVRLRDRQDSIRDELAEVRWQVNDLREWRAHARVQLEDLVKADELADAVADRLNEQGQNALTRDGIRVQKWQAYVATVAVVTAIVAPWIEKATS